MLLADSDDSIGLFGIHREDREDRRRHIRVGAREILIEVAQSSQGFLQVKVHYETRNRKFAYSVFGMLEIQNGALRLISAATLATCLKSNYGNHLRHSPSPAFLALFPWVPLVHQAIDLAGEKDPGESRRQSEKNKGAGLLVISDVARQASDQSVCAGFAS